MGILQTSTVLGLVLRVLTNLHHLKSDTGVTGTSTQAFPKRATTPHWALIVRKGPFYGRMVFSQGSALQCLGFRDLGLEFQGLGSPTFGDRMSLPKVAAL